MNGGLWMEWERRVKKDMSKEKESGMISAQIWLTKEQRAFFREHGYSVRGIMQKLVSDFVRKEEKRLEDEESGSLY